MSEREITNEWDVLKLDLRELWKDIASEFYPSLKREPFNLDDSSMSDQPEVQAKFARLKEHYR